MRTAPRHILTYSIDITGVSAATLNIIRAVSLQGAERQPRSVAIVGLLTTSDRPGSSVIDGLEWIEWRHGGEALSAAELAELDSKALAVRETTGRRIAGLFRSSLNEV